MSEALTKKQAKAKAFKNKQKAKKRGEAIPDDIPEQDDIEQAENEDKGDSGTAVASSSKLALEEKPQKSEKAKQKNKRKTAWDEEDGDAKDGKKDKKEIKQRFILFVGNMDYKTTREDIQAHFTDAVGHRPAVRLLTTKPIPGKSKSKACAAPQSRGIAFLELQSSSELQACLKLHHSSLGGRKINVELTAGGGGKSQGRKDKIQARNERIGGQRERKAEKDREETGADDQFGNGQGTVENAGNPMKRERKRKRGDRGDRGEGSDRQSGKSFKSDQGAEGGQARAPRERPAVEVISSGDGVVKNRGGRRVKAKPSHGYTGGGAPNRGLEQTSRGGGAQRGFGRLQGGSRKFVPTGANALNVS